MLSCKSTVGIIKNIQDAFIFCPDINCSRIGLHRDYLHEAHCPVGNIKCSKLFSTALIHLGGKTNIKFTLTHITITTTRSNIKTGACLTSKMPSVCLTGLQNTTLYLLVNICARSRTVVPPLPNEASLKLCGLLQRVNTYPEFFPFGWLLTEWERSPILRERGRARTGNR